jgi:pimeloyl-ACP methyl ester carboxylesterase
MSLFNEVRGAGSPALVFIHGLSCDHSDWEEQVRHFEARHRCISVDLPGHGASPSGGRPLGIERFIAEAHETVAPQVRSSGGRAVVFGHSMGCRVAMGVAARLGAQAAGIVLVDGSRFGSGDPEAIRASVLAKVAEIGIEQTMENTFVPMFTADSPADLKARAIARAKALDPLLAPGLLADMAAWDAANIQRVVGEIRIPLMAIQSTSIDASRNRTIIAPGQGSDFTDRLMEWAASPRIEIIPGVGHFTMNEAPQRVNALVEDFLRDL